MSLAARLFNLIPARSSLLYRLSKRYLDRYNGDNNPDMQTNGEIVLLRQRLPGARVVFDVGAHEGHWTALALEINPALQVHCFEPAARAFNALSAQNFPPSVVRNHAALGAETGELEMYISSLDSQMNTLYPRRGAATGIDETRRERVAVDTGDAYCAAHGIEVIDFLKVDVEGHELAVLRGFERMLSERRVRCIQFEYGGTNIDSGVLLKQMWELLEGHRFRLFKLFPDGPRPMLRYEQTLETFQYQNWAAVLDA